MPRSARPTVMSQRLKDLRKQHHLTQLELSDVTGIAAGTLATWESGRVQDIGMESLRKLAPAYGMTPEALMQYLFGAPESDGATVQFSDAVNLPPEYLAEIGEFVVRKMAEWEAEKRKAEGS